MLDVELYAGSGRAGVSDVGVRCVCAELAVSWVRMLGERAVDR